MSHLVASPGFVQSPGNAMAYNSPATPLQQQPAVHHQQQQQQQQQPQQQYQQHQQQQQQASGQSNTTATAPPTSSHTATAKQAPAQQGSSATRPLPNAEAAAAWKSESEETAKTRKNALRVIVAKLRNFWPGTGDAKLSLRAAELEEGVYSTTNSKGEYITRLQKDLHWLGAKKDAEMKAAKATLLSSGDMYAAIDLDEKVMHYHICADARAKYVQKVHMMEKKHHNLFAVANNLPAKATGPEAHMKQYIQSYRQLAANLDKGPYEIEHLNRIDEKLDSYRQAMMQRSRQAGWGRESLEKQNDRTSQVAARTLNKLRKLNHEHPFVITDLGWTLESEFPTVSNPPEFTIRPSTQPPVSHLPPPSDPTEMAGRPSKAPRLLWCADGGGSEGGYIPSVRPYRTPGCGGQCVPSVRESHVLVTFTVPSSRSKGFVDFDIPNDGDNQETSTGDATATPLFSLECVCEQIEHALHSLPSSHALALTHEALQPSGFKAFTLTQRAATLGADGSPVHHAVTVTLDPHVDQGSSLPWDTRIEVLRRLPITVEVSPPCLLTEELLAAISLHVQSPSACEWVQGVVSGVCDHLACVDALQLEVAALAERHEHAVSFAMNNVPPRGGARTPPGVTVELKCGVMEGRSGFPGLVLVASGLEYPRATPYYALTGLCQRLPSAMAFEELFKRKISKLPAPLNLTQIAECWLETLLHVVSQ